MSNVFLKLYELDQYNDTELVRKKTDAMFAGFITRFDPEMNLMEEGEPNEHGVALSELELSTMQLLDPDEDIKFSEPSDVGDGILTKKAEAFDNLLGMTSYERLHEHREIIGV